MVADDHRMIREAIRLALAGAKDIEIVAEAANGAEVLSCARDFWPDVVLLDIRMPQSDGLDILKRLRARYPRLRVAMLSAIDDPEVAAEALQLGAVAFLGKRVDPGALAETIRSIATGTLEMQTVAVGDNAADRGASDAGLTVRELEILNHIATGRSTREIASELWLSQQTVKYHLTNLYRKLGVSGRAEAVRYAFAHGLLDRAARPSRDRSSAA